MPHIPFKNLRFQKSSDEKDVEELIAELRQFIPAFVGSSIFKRDIFDDSQENDYTETFIKYILNENPNSRFNYMNQASLPNRRSADIGIYLKADSEHYLFCVEAKFLPPKDYVQGDYAAIKRYKKLEHGVSSRNPNKAKPLSESAILAYSKSGKFIKHLEKINKHITELSRTQTADNYNLTWNNSEKLQVITMNETAILVSEHHRNNNLPIKLHHFWVYVNV